MSRCELVRIFLTFVYKYIVVGYPVIKKGDVGSH